MACTGQTVTGLVKIQRTENNKLFRVRTYIAADQSDDLSRNNFHFETGIFTGFTFYNTVGLVQLYSGFKLTTVFKANMEVKKHYRFLT